MGRAGGFLCAECAEGEAALYRRVSEDPQLGRAGGVQNFPDGDRGGKPGSLGAARWNGEWHASGITGHGYASGAPRGDHAVCAPDYYGRGYPADVRPETVTGGIVQMSENQQTGNVYGTYC